MQTHPLPPPGFACVMQDLKLSFNVQWFRDLGASLSSFGCFVFEIWVLRASCFGLRFRVLRFRNYLLDILCMGFLSLRAQLKYGICRGIVVLVLTKSVG